ncbi:MAG: NAD(P)/FAD-dependent oxidoreductase [Deltaproteobacteria bacterium]|jgi:all-trans-retinol 13,14-reductase|nr:NAD(P)/FAD-dependent oxidoreductase [Deltaproteobacteria bacterium]
MSRTVVVGSGISGLTVAARLAKAGRQVLVLEKKPLAGGALHRFKRRKIPFDVGFHYTGNLGPGDITRRLWRYLGVEPLVAITPFPRDGHDHLQIHGRSQPVQASFSYPRLTAHLKEQFPAEQGAIDRYFAVIQEICAAIPFYNLDLPLTPLLQGMASRHLPLAAFLDSLTSNQELQAVFALPTFLYGVPVSRARLDVHAMVAHSYYMGAYTVAGGGQAIVDAHLKILARYGVEVRTSAAVEAIVDDGRRVCGVLVDGEFIAGTDLIFTGHPTAMLNLVNRDFFRPAYTSRLRELENTMSMYALFGRLPAGAAQEALQWRNYYSLPPGPAEFHDFMGSSPAQRQLMMSSPGARDSQSLSAGREGVILLAPAHWQEVARFHDSTPRNRSAAYGAFKEEVAARMIGHAARTWGDGYGAIEPLAVGTPLTFRDELSAPQGSCYGAMCCLGQYNPGVRTRLPGLWLSGQSTLMTGVVGAALGALVTAGEMTGLEGLWEEVRQCQ